jgi:outer membrane receptor protein involved in Fe transport
MSKNTKLLFATASAVVLTSIAGQALAQAPAAGPVQVEEVVVTGSRIARRDFVSSSPIVTQSIEAIQASGQIGLENVLEQLPQFAPGQGENTTPLGGGGRATLNLRNLGEARNLVLLDGRRLQPSTSAGVVDINSLPQGVIGGVEVISGGASAVYGSDALAGVVNFQTRKSLQGVEMNASYGQSFKGDAKRRDVSVTAGDDFADGRGRALFSIGYTQRDRLALADREFYLRTLGNLNSDTGSFSPDGANLPSQAAVNALFGTYGVAPGTVRNSQTLYFNPDGTLRLASPAVNSRVPLGVATQPAATGNGEYILVNNAVQFRLIGGTLVAPMTRKNFFGKLEYNVTPTTKAYAQAYYVNSRVLTPVEYSTQLGAWLPKVPAANPYIPADLRTLLATRPNPNAPFTLTQTMSKQQFGPREWLEQFNTYQFLLGATGELPVKDWRWDVYGSSGGMDGVETLRNAVSISALQRLFDAPDGGVALCGGYNPFGGKTIPAACTTYFTRTSTNTTTLRQNVVEGTVQGSLLTLPAGDARFAAGAGWRKNSLKTAPDPALASGDYVAIPGTSAADGEVSVKEIFGELSIPVLANLPLIQELTLEPAARYSDYSVSGGVSAWKVDINWRLNKFVRLRGGFEHAVRAPSLSELFDSPRDTPANVGTPQTGQGDPCDVRGPARAGAAKARVEALCVAQGVPASILATYIYPRADASSTARSNVNLEPEAAETVSYGTVLSSPFDHPLLSNLRMSVDYYRIRIRDQISFLNAATSVSRCFNLDGSNPTYSSSNYYCGLITRDKGTGLFTQIGQPSMNLGGFRTSGIDVQVDWAARLSDLGLPENSGRVSLSVVVNKLREYSTQDLTTSPFRNFTDTGANPEWKVLTTLGYSIGPVAADLRYRYIDAVNDLTSVTRPASPAPGTAAREYFDLSVRWTVSDNLELRGTVTNLLDEAPPVVGGTPGTTNSALYEVVGRAFNIALRARF